MLGIAKIPPVFSFFPVLGDYDLFPGDSADYWPREASCLGS